MMSTRRVLLATTSSRLPPAFLSTFRLGLSSTSASVRDFSSPSPPSTPATPPIVRNSSGNTLPKPIIPFVPDFVLKAMGYYSSETTQIRRSENLFRAAELQASKANFYTLGNISKDFKTKHILLCLHVWCIHKRLISPTLASDMDYNRDLQEALFDRLWDNTGSRIRAMGVRELMFNKHLKEVQSYTFECLAQLDHSRTMKSYKERHEELSLAIWRVVYGCSETVSDEHCASMARYIERELDKVMMMDEILFLDGRIDFGRAPNFKGLKTRRRKGFRGRGEVKEELFEVEGEEEEEGEERLLDQVEGLPAGWRSALTDGGKEYWWHVETRESVWERPV